MKKLIVMSVSALVAAMGFANDLAEMKSKIGQEHKVISVDKFHGFDRVVFDFQGYEAWVVCPTGGTREGRPWTWCMQWATAFVPRTNVPQMLRDGYHHVTINTFSHRMDETGLKVSAAFQDFLVGNLGFAKKANLIGMSWGGFFSVRYANSYPQNVAKIYMDAPLLCFKDFRVGIGPWESRMPSEGWQDSPEMPLNMAESLAKADIPVLVLYGGADVVCPPANNCEPFMKRFRAAGGDLTVIKRGLYAHHPHGVELDETTIKDFFERPKVLPVADYPGAFDHPVKEDRRQGPVFKLDKTTDENAYYRLTFQAKSTADGYWWVDMNDEAGKRIPDVNSRLDATSDWKAYSVLVPTRPDAATAAISFVSKGTFEVQGVRMVRIPVAEACDMVHATYAAGPQLRPEVTVKAWDLLPNTRVAIKVAKDFTIVFLGDSVMNDTWCGGVNALVAAEYPDTVFHSYLSVRDSTGCWYYQNPNHFDEYVGRYKPNFVVIGGISNYKEKEMSLQEAEDAVVQTIERCRTIGAEVVVCSPAKSHEFRTDPAAQPFSAAAFDGKGPAHLQSDYLRRAAARAGVQFWDMTIGPCEAVAGSGKPLGWFNRDKVHSDDQGKALNTMMLYRYFNAAQK